MSRRFIWSWQFGAGAVTALASMGVALAIASGSVAADGPVKDTFTCTVTKVHNGDGPIWCAEGPKIRLQAIAARELDETCSRGHPCPDASGAEAQQALARLAMGQTLQCVATGTSYSRVTVWCWRPDGVELNCAMVKSGTALRWAKYDRDRRLCR